MTTHKKYSQRQPDYGFNTKNILDTTVKVVQIGAVTTVGVAAINAIKVK